VTATAIQAGTFAAGRSAPLRRTSAGARWYSRCIGLAVATADRAEDVERDTIAKTRGGPVVAGAVVEKHATINRRGPRGTSMPDIRTMPDVRNLCDWGAAPDFKQIVGKSLALFGVFTGVRLSFYIKDSCSATGYRPASRNFPRGPGPSSRCRSSRYCCATALAAQCI